MDLGDRVFDSICNGDGHWLACIKDTLQVSATFLVHGMLKNALQEGRQVVLIALASSLEQYKYCMRKQGVILQNFLELGQLKVLEAKDLGLSSPCLFASGRGAAAKKLESIHSILVESLHGLESTSRELSERSLGTNAGADGRRPEPSSTRDGATGSGSGRTGVTVIFDCLSALSGLGCSAREWLSFVHRISSIPREVESSWNGSSLCALVAYSDVPDDKHWLAALEHLSDVTVDVTKLEAQMAGIDGIVSITRRTAPTGGDRGGPPSSSSASASSTGQLQSSSSAGRRETTSVFSSLMEGGEPFDAVLRLFFKCGEAGVKWIPQVGMSDLLG